MRAKPRVHSFVPSAMSHPATRSQSQTQSRTQWAETFPWEEPDRTLWVRPFRLSHGDVAPVIEQPVGRVLGKMLAFSQGRAPSREPAALSPLKGQSPPSEVFVRARGELFPSDPHKYVLRGESKANSVEKGSYGPPPCETRPDCATASGGPSRPPGGARCISDHRISPSVPCRVQPAYCGSTTSPGSDSRRDGSRSSNQAKPSCSRVSARV